MDDDNDDSQSHLPLLLLLPWSAAEDCEDCIDDGVGDDCAGVLETLRIEVVVHGQGMDHGYKVVAMNDNQESNCSDGLQIQMEGIRVHSSAVAVTTDQ